MSIKRLQLLVFCITFSNALRAALAFGWYAPHSTHTSITQNGLDLVLKELYKIDNLVQCAKNNPGYRKAVEEFIEGNHVPDTDDEMFYTAHYHFDSEQFWPAFENLATRRETARKFLERGYPSSARKQLGIALHAVQDFYSHTNWIEAGNKEPSPGTLGNPSHRTFGMELADKDTPTCVPCQKKSGCDKNVIIDKLTSSYFIGEMDPDGKTIEKPKGKCNHGAYDPDSSRDPIGGINKDQTASNHGDLHSKAAKTAERATVAFMMDFRREIGDLGFLELLGLDDLQIPEDLTSCVSSTTTVMPTTAGQGAKKASVTLASNLEAKLAMGAKVPPQARYVLRGPKVRC